MFKNKSILITGATGSFGKAFIKKILSKNFSFRRIVIFSRDELKQHEMQNNKNYDPNINKNLRYFIGDVRDKNRLMQAFEDIDYVVPGNDDSHKAIDLYTRLVADTIDVAREKIREKIRAAEVKMEGKTKVKVVKKSKDE